MVKIFIFFVTLTLVYGAKNSAKTKDPCKDYPSCKLISDQMFANYCSRSTLKSMCPTHCDPKCKNSTTEILVKVLDVESLEEEDYEEEEESQNLSLSTSSTTTKKRAKHSRKKGSKKKNKQSKTTTTTLSTPEQTTISEEIFNDEESVEIEETSPLPKPKSTKLKVSTTQISSAAPTTTVKVLHTEKDDSMTTKTVANLPNETIYVPLYEAGFVQRVIPTSNKPECDFSRAIVCKKENCNHNAVWCPVTNDVPKEQIEILLNYTTDIYMFETQGRIDTNESVTNFLLQYLNDAGVLVSHLYRTDTKNSSVINKFMFEPAIRTNYIRLTPIDYVESIALRFEVYSKGVLYKPDKDK